MELIDAVSEQSPFVAFPRTPALPAGLPPRVHPSPLPRPDPASLHRRRPSDVLLISGPAAAAARRVPSSAVYRLYYTGSTDERFGSLFPDADVPALPGLAISQDGPPGRASRGTTTPAWEARLGWEEEPRGWEARGIAAPKVLNRYDEDPSKLSGTQLQFTF